MSELTPELAVADLARSLGFYRDILGFSVADERPEDGFACLRYEALELMVDQIGIGRTWETGPLDHPLGRGLNLQCRVSGIDPLLVRLEQAQVPLYLPVETRTYRAGDRDVAQRQFCVQDPDGYLLRFCEDA